MRQTGNYYYGARYYNPKWNVWLSVDPLVEMFPDRPPYEYCFSNPLRYIDPTGMGPEPPTEKGEYEGQECYDEDTGATYLADNNGNWHSDLGGVHNLNEVVVGAEKSTGNTFFITDGKSRKRHPLEYMKSDTPWMDKAKSQLGVKEDFVNGSYNNTGSDVEKYMKSSGLPKGNPWCGAFVFWSLDESGINVTGVKGNPNWALNWRGFGNSIASPAYGAIATKKRTKGGHVGFVAGKTASGDVILLGGNQDDSVNYQSFPASQLKYNYPNDYIPNYNLQIISNINKNKKMQ